MFVWSEGYMMQVLGSNNRQEVEWNKEEFCMVFYVTINIQGTQL